MLHPDFAPFMCSLAPVPTCSVVVLCEVDFKELNAKELRKLFVGFTRAQLRLECILSTEAEKLLMSR